MNGHGRAEAPRRWVLRGSGRASFIFSSVVCVLLLVLGFVLVGFVLWGSVGAAPLVPAVILLAVGALVASQLLRCATEVTLHPDGTLVCRRPIGVLRTRADRVRRTSRSVLNRSGRRTPIVLHTADGSVLLTHGPDAVADMMAAIGGRRPPVSGERGA